MEQAKKEYKQARTEYRRLINVEHKTEQAKKHLRSAEQKFYAAQKKLFCKMNGVEL